MEGEVFYEKLVTSPMNTSPCNSEDSMPYKWSYIETWGSYGSEYQCLDEPAASFIALKDGGIRFLQKNAPVYQNVWCHIPEFYNFKVKFVGIRVITVAFCSFRHHNILKLIKYFWCFLSIAVTCIIIQHCCCKKLHT